MADATTPDSGDLARRDLEEGLRQFSFARFDIQDDLSPAAGVDVVAWEAAAEHVGAWMGAPATRLPVVIQGVTFIKHDEDGQPRFRRYIDWLDLFNQLGLNGAMRPARLGGAGDIERLARQRDEQEAGPGT